MPELTDAQQVTLDELIERFDGDGEQFWDGEDAVFVVAAPHPQVGKSFLIAPDGAMNELEDPSAGDDMKAVPPPLAGPESSDPGVPEDQRAATEAHKASEATASAPPASNVAFPLNSFRDAAIHLRRPFTAEAVKWKVQATWPSGALIAPYIDARLAIERLNLVVPHLWFDEYEPLAGGKGLLCHLTVDGITRRDVGTGYEGKGLFSDAFKRAAVKFGIGVSLYALPKVTFNNGSGFLDRKTKKSPRGEKEVVTLSDKGIERCHSGYRGWLAQTGESMFWTALDHGDVFGAYGDVDDTAVTIETEPVEPEPEKLTDAKATALIRQAEELKTHIPAAELSGPSFNRQLVGAWDSHEKLERFLGVLEAMVPGEMVPIEATP